MTIGAAWQIKSVDLGISFIFDYAFQGVNVIAEGVAAFAGGLEVGFWFFIDEGFFDFDVFGLF